MFIGLRRMHCWQEWDHVSNQTGYLKILCSKKEQKTILQEIYFTRALKVTRAVYLSPYDEAYLYIMNPGGGYIEGDSYKMEVQLERNAEVVLTTQSSTKIYKTIKNPAFQDVEIYLKKGSILEYVPDPVIAFQQASFIQKTAVYMESGASFISTDIFTPGWAPDGSLFRYDLIQSRINIFLDGRLILFDHVKLKPDNELNGIGWMEGYTHLGTMVVINERITPVLLDELFELLQIYTESRIGLSMLTVPGFTLRVLSNSTQSVEKIFHCCHETIRQRIFNKTLPFLRKY